MAASRDAPLVTVVTCASLGRVDNSGLLSLDATWAGKGKKGRKHGPGGQGLFFAVCPTHCTFSHSPIHTFFVCAFGGSPLLVPQPQFQFPYTVGLHGRVAPIHEQGSTRDEAGVLAGHKGRGRRHLGRGAHPVVDHVACQFCHHVLVGFALF